MKANRLSLVHSLFSIINENDENDTNYVLAHYFLNHYHELNSLNIYDISEECFVSRSSVRRFCKSIGYENFLDLKKEFSSYDDRYQSYMRYANRDNYRERLTQEINEMIIELDQRMDTREVYEIARRMKESRYTVFLTSGTTAGLVRDFQESMVLNKKVISLVSELYSDNPLLHNLNEDDYLITISNTGTFAHASYPLVKHTKAYKTLITLKRDPLFNRQYDKIYHLSAVDRSDKGENVYGKYGISYMLDIIFSEYTRKFSN